MPSPPTATKAGEKLTLYEAAHEVSNKYPEIITEYTQRLRFKSDFVLLVQTFVMDGCCVSSTL